MNQVYYYSTETVYRKCKLAQIQKVTHDTNLYRIELPEGCRMCVPVGHHVHIKANVEGKDCYSYVTYVNQKNYVVEGCKFNH